MHWSLKICCIRPKPPYGRQGLAGRDVGPGYSPVGTFRVFSTSHFAPTALSSAIACSWNSLRKYSFFVTQGSPNWPFRCLDFLPFLSLLWFFAVWMSYCFGFYSFFVSIFVNFVSICSNCGSILNRRIERKSKVKEMEMKVVKNYFEDFFCKRGIRPKSWILWFSSAKKWNPLE